MKQNKTVFAGFGVTQPTDVKGGSYRRDVQGQGSKSTETDSVYLHSSRIHE